MRYDYERLRDSGYYIGNIRIAASLNEIHFPDGTIQKLQPRLISVLTVLACYGYKVTPREKIMKKVWPDFTYGEFALNQAISQLRKILGDNKNEPSIIVTIPKKGYRLLPTVSLKKSGNFGVFRFRKFTNVSYGISFVFLLISGYFFFNNPKPERQMVIMQNADSAFVQNITANLENAGSNPEDLNSILEELKTNLQDTTLQIIKDEGQVMMLKKESE